VPARSSPAPAPIPSRAWAIRDWSTWPRRSLSFSALTKIWSTLSPYFATERELALFVTRRDLFDAEVHRVWERRASASDEIGDGIPHRGDL